VTTDQQSEDAPKIQTQIKVHGQRRENFLGATHFCLHTHTHTCRACQLGISRLVCMCVVIVYKMGILCMRVRVYQMGILCMCICTMGILVLLHTSQLWKHINRGYSRLTYTLNRGYPQLT